MFFQVIKIIVYLAFAGLLPSLAIAFYLSRDKAHLGLLDRLLTAMLLSPLVLVLVSFLEEVVHIPQSGAVITINLVVLGLLNLYVLARYFLDRRHYRCVFSWGRMVFLLLFAAVVVYRIWPTLDLATPLLHDPISHSEWLKQLNQTHFTTRQNWYPQGLEYYLNYFAMFFDVNYPRIVLTWTNLFSALFPVGFFYMGMLLVGGDRRRNILYPIALFALAAISRIPTDLYYLAGKNSMIFLLSSSPVILYAMYAARGRTGHLVSALLLSGAVVIHYPTGFCLLVAYLVFSLARMTVWSGSRVSADRGMLRDFLAGVAALVLFAVFLAYRVIPIYRAYPPENDRSAAPVLDFIGRFGVLKYVTHNYYLSEVALLGTAAVLLFLAAAAVLLFSDSKGVKRGFTLRFLLSFVVIYLLEIVALLLPNKTWGVFLSFQNQFFFVLLQVAVSAWFIDYVFSRRGLLASAPVRALAVFGLSLLVIYTGSHQYDTYKLKQDELGTTADADLEAFRYIDQEIPDERKFLIQMNNGADIVMGADSGVWIPSFTGRQVEVDFTGFADPESYDVFDMYMRLARDPDDGEALDRLYCDYDVGYVFFGSRKVFSDNMQEETLDGSASFRKVFDNGASIYEIRPRACGTPQPATPALP